MTQSPQQFNQFIASLPQLLSLGLTMGAMRGMMSPMIGGSAPLAGLPKTEAKTKTRRVKVTIQATVLVNPEVWDVQGVVESLNTQGVAQSIYDLTQHYIDEKASSIRAEIVG